MRDACTVRGRGRVVLSKLSAGEHGIILGHLPNELLQHILDQLLNPLEPCLAVYLSSASRGLRLLLTPALLQQLKADHEAAAALCLNVGTSCKELHEAEMVQWVNKGLSAANLGTLGKLGSVLPALETLVLLESSGAADPDGVQRLAEGLCAGALPAVTFLAFFANVHVGDAGASALAAALSRGALPQLENLALSNSAIGDAGLVALAPALRRPPALETLDLRSSPFGDEGLAALLAPPPPAGALPPPTGVLTKLKKLNLFNTQVTDAGCAALAAALDSGALPALEELGLFDIPASAAAKAAVGRAGLEVS